MAPEQAKGKRVDKRVDIWSWGVVLYELLTGDRLFKGDDTADTLAQVLTKEPDLERVPAQVRRLLRRCLEKDPKQRLRDIGDARFVVVDESATTGSSHSRVNTALLAIAAILLVAFGILVFIHWREPQHESQVIERFSIPAPEKGLFSPSGGMDVSPDGRRLVFTTTTAEGKTQLWIRALASLTSVPLAGTEGATFPFWSADGEHIGFFADGKLKRIDAAGGFPLTLYDAPNGLGGTWNREGVIVFAPSIEGPLYQISAAGGTASAVTILDSSKREGTHAWPWFLPDGRHFLYRAGSTGAIDGTIHVASIDSPGHDSRIIMQSQSNALYSQGYLLFLREKTLMAQPFDAKRLATTAEAVPVAEQVRILPTYWRAAIAVSANGFLVYRSGESAAGAQLAWFDRNGKQTATLGQPGLLSGIRIAPDQKSVAISMFDSAANNRDIWLYDLARKRKTRFTFGAAEEREPIWSPDGQSIVFNSNLKGHFDLYRKPSNGAGVEELLYADDKDKYPTSFSPDGKLLLYMVYYDPASKNQLWILPLDGPPGGERKPVLFAQTAFNATWGQFSPDGRWIAYASDESQRSEIYVALIPGPGGKKQISTAGGDQPVWRNDGKEIFYLGGDHRLIAAEVSSNSDVLELGAIQPLFGPIAANPGHSYDVSADGQRFLVRAGVQDTNVEPLTLVHNWTLGLKK
jgi:Tol biopolymer transport system component